VVRGMGSGGVCKVVILRLGKWPVLQYSSIEESGRRRGKWMREDKKNRERKSRRLFAAITNRLGWCFMEYGWMRVNELGKL
jgi:hypothetical protein